MLHTHVTHENLFYGVSILSIPAWIALGIAPHWRVSKTVVTTTVALLSTLYIAVFFDPIPKSFEALSAFYVNQFTSFQHLIDAIQSPHAVLTTWINTAVLHLVTALWLTSDARRISLPMLVTLPSVVLTVFNAPAGILLYVVLLRPLFGAIFKGLSRDAGLDGLPSAAQRKGGRKWD